jgi:hypothetical protein
MKSLDRVVHFIFRYGMHRGHGLYLLLPDIESFAISGPTKIHLVPGSPVHSLISENRVLLPALFVLLIFAAENREMPVPMTFSAEFFDLRAENPPNSLYLSLLAGNPDSLR